MKKCASAIHHYKDPNYLTTVEAGGHKFIVDEPESQGGQGSGASPSEHLCASLSSCTAITLKMYLERKEWPVESIEVYSQKEKDPKDGTDRFMVEVNVTGGLNPEQLKKVEIIAGKCPIHKIIARGNPIKIFTIQS